MLPDMDSHTLHHSLLTFDSHIDIPWPDGPGVFEDSPKRHVDIPKMERGSLSAGCLVAYVPQGPRTDEGRSAARDRALAMLETIRRIGEDAASHGKSVRVVDTADAIEAAHRDKAIAILPAVENGYAMGTDLTVLDRFRALGARYLTLTHNGHNDIADSARPIPALGDKGPEHHGLSALGRDVIQRLNRLGMLVDVSHASKETMLQAADLSTTPVVATHSCVRALCDHPRNLDDEQLDVLKSTGGLIQITAMDGFLRKGGTLETVGVADFVDHIDYVVRRIGIAHVGISSDFDGGGEITGWRNAADSPNLTAELVKRGYDEAAIQAFWGGNFLRLLRIAEQRAG
ncbi:Microsomal dipeptidase [Granulibacter bethesdensis CGDNIH1]|uniref:Microsomal dipeptidase n=2 Tax=Granulibacter bethesdensis TaxID=364410 RepID=Q0BPI9_GRABC|nr:Microsomal dipeptidase [Granulibacter bethesdensis CGDNIH1]APH53144.1 Microsomal dipeptidase [Granulibacter bethesdensis]APH65833.1 Microsomal dipeptidase [Granulibacter bethesdensis]